MSFHFNNYDFDSLSISDLLEARDLYHLHLMNKENVVATAVGYYRIRKNELWPGKLNPNPDNKKFKGKERTLENSEVRPYSWPSILVFVKEWETELELVKKDASQIVPKTLFLPNGKAVPVCVILASKFFKQKPFVELSSFTFPRNVISGGFPLFTRVQQELHIASLGCLVTDGHLTYALTNKHVCGEAGTPVYTLLNGKEIEIGVVSQRQLGRIGFQDIYPGFKGKDVYLNMDIGLIELHDKTIWKTEIYKIGRMDELIDLHSNTFTLQLIGKKISGYGCSSGLIEGNIEALFYRYKSVGGFEYVSDFLISTLPDKNKTNKKLVADKIKYGDSGTILLLESVIKDDKSKKIKEIRYHPIAILWGRQELGDINESQSFALATSLSTTCNLLEIDIVRDWNLDIPNTWGKTGHFKIAAKACELVTNTKLKKLLMLNQKNIGYTDDDLKTGNVVSGKFSHDFVPLADVADIIWRSTRKADEANHFADMDESNSQVFNGKSLLDLCKNVNNVDIDIWNQYYTAFEQVDSTKDDDKRGALPFRIWQMYSLMVGYLKKKKLAEFVCVGGLMSHYAGDACQPLHVSYLHHGENKNEAAVHSDYETKFVDSKMIEIFEGVNSTAKKVKKTDLIGDPGKEAAIAIIKLMRKTFQILAPRDVLDVWRQANGRGKYDFLWNELGDRTIKVIANGATTLAILWQSAWEAGNGDAISDTSIKEISKDKLMQLYNKKEFAPSYKLKDPKFKAELS